MPLLGVSFLSVKSERLNTEEWALSSDSRTADSTKVPMGYTQNEQVPCTCKRDPSKHRPSMLKTCRRHSSAVAAVAVPRTQSLFHGPDPWARRFPRYPQNVPYIWKTCFRSVDICVSIYLSTYLSIYLSTPIIYALCMYVYRHTCYTQPQISALF